MDFHNDIANPRQYWIAVFTNHRLRLLVLSSIFLFKGYILFLIVYFWVMASGSGLAQESSGGQNANAMHDEFVDPSLSIKSSTVTTLREPKRITDDNISDSLVSSVSEIYCRLRTSTNKTAVEELLSNLSRFSENYTDDLPELLERKTIRVLITSSSTNFFVSRGQIYGFEYSMLKEYEKFLNQGTRLQDLKTVVEFIPVPEEILAPSLEEGLGDIAAAGLVVSDESHQSLSYTAPYLSGVNEVFVSHRSTHPILKLNDIAGKQIYLRRIKNYYESVTRLNEQLNIAGLDPVRIVKADDYVTSEDILEMINAGIIELSIIESHLAELWSDVLPNLMIHNKFPLRTNVNLAWMVRKNNPLLKDSLNQFVKDHKKGTLLGNIYFNRYFKDTKWITNPLDKGVRERSFRYAPLFKKYGEEYNIDWMLLSAIGYQESLLDHGQRSPKGAVGIMQVLPSTAMDPKINITDYHQIEENIHAGAKYLAHLRDSYFNGTEMEPIDRLRFALAAYNAGPSNVRRAQAVAAKLGYDPNRWFLHGEIGALKVIGQETVRYVSNINKFYLAYSLSDTLDCLKERNAENNEKKKVKVDTMRRKEIRWVNKH